MANNYIYIFKCIVGSRNDVVKIGKTKHFYDESDRMAQHGRTPYYGFVPYLDFVKRVPIATGFLVKDLSKSDNLIKERFEDYQFAGLEIYNIDYEDAIKKIYNILVGNNEFVELSGDGYTDYSFINVKFADINDDSLDNYSSGKKDFEDIKDKLLEKYSNDDFPEELLDMLRDKTEFEKNCVSHFNSKSNWIDFTKDLILDFNFNKTQRKIIMRDLTKILKDDKKS